MNNTKVRSIYFNLEKEFCQICSEVDNFMGNVLQWADELGGIVEKEFAEGNEPSTFQLPKTPSVKKTRNRKPRNALVSKCSVLNSTVDCNETTDLNETISTRTRAARKAATSKISQFNIVQEVHHNSDNAKRETKVLEVTAKENVTDTTFVVPQATTRTKPVHKKKHEAQEVAPPEPETQEESENTTQSTPEREPVRRKTSRTLSESPPERQSRRKISKTVTSSPEVENSELPPVLVHETPIQRTSRRNITRTLSESPVQRPSHNKSRRTLSGSPVTRTSQKSPIKSPVISTRSSGGRVSSKSPVARSSTKKLSTSQEGKEKKESFVNRTITIKKERVSKGTSPVLASSNDEQDGNISSNSEEKTPRNKGRFTRLSKTSTPVDGEKTPMVKDRLSSSEMGEDAGGNMDNDVVTENNIDATYSVEVEREAEEESEDVDVPKKKRKLKKEEETFKENIEEVANTRITRTKSKAIKKMMEETETQQADLSNFAKKLVNKAKMTSLKKNQLAALLECNKTPNSRSNNLPFGNLTSKSKYHLLLSSSTKLKTPLATLPNSAVKVAKPSGDKDRLKTKIAKRDSSVENAVRSVAKPAKDDTLEREIKLKAKKDKEEEAALKRQDVIKKKQEELKRKNELKHQMAMKQREKLEQEKYNNIIQSEKEKEERHKLILQERQMKLKEEAFKKKMLTQQKLAETVERRRMEEEARIAKLKEMEAEEQRALEKQREQERQEKRAQERLAEKKAREEYEMKLKQEIAMSTAKNYLQSASKMQSASKRQKFAVLGEKRDWDYKPRNENDYGLEDEHSEVDSEDERSYDKAKPPVPWGKKIMSGRCPLVKVLTLEMLCEYMPCYQKSPDIYKMFKMTPSKRIKRSSSAIWNTPSS